MKKRAEKDVLGKIDVDENAYYGSFTQRARENFQLSGIKADSEFIKSLAMIKKAAAMANSSLGVLDKNKANAIIKAADEVIANKFSDNFVLDVFQAGAGTPFNMNMNEVIANRATELLGGKKGQYLVHPNNDVNMAQSSNDVIPTAVRLASLFLLKKLMVEIKNFENSLRKKSREFEDILKTGRTHFEDAVPITLGQEFGAWADSIEKNIVRIKNAEKEILELGIGGTAIGTGINTHPEFKDLVIENLKKIANIDVYKAKNSIETTQSMDCFVSLSNALRILAIDLFRIANNLSILNSGPKAGIGEVILPEVEPGSSIMPGKINPSIPEAVIMCCYQAFGNDAAISNAAQYSILELNVMTPVIAHNLFQSEKLLANALKMFREKCIDGIKANEERCLGLLNSSFAFATALNPYLGYDVVSKIVHDALKKNKTLKEIILENKIINESDLNCILNTKNMTKPGIINKKLAEKIRKSENFKKFVKKM